MWMGNVSSKAVKPNKKRHTKTLNHENIDVNRRETLERIENLKSLFSEDNVIVDCNGKVSSHVVTDGPCGRVNRTTDLIVDSSRGVNSSALTGGDYPTLTIVTREPCEPFNGTTNCVGPGDCVSRISNGVSGTSVLKAVSGKILSSDTSRISSHNGGPETSLQNGVSIGINEQQEIRNAHFDKIREPPGLPSASSRIPTRVTTLTNNDIVEYNNVSPVQSSSLSGSGSSSSSSGSLGSSSGSLGSSSDKLNFKRKCIRDGRVIEEECMDTDNTLNVCEPRKHNEFTSVAQSDPHSSRPSPDFKVEELSLPKPFSSSSSTSATVSFPTSEISSSTAAMGPSTAAMGPSTAASNYPLNFLTTDDQDRYFEMGDQYTEIQYDAYINCTDNHISLAKIFIENLQNPPYNFNLFLPQKQLLLGSWDMDVKREIVETRCSGKVIALLGRDHGDSDSCHFINYFAKTLDPTAKLSKLIPVIVEEMETFPKITDGMHRIFYQRDNGRGFLWDKLNSALMFRGSDVSE